MLALEAADPRGKLRASVQHLQAGYRYTLAPGAFRTGDPLAEFLFEKKAGYCEYFASAAVVLLRLQGVPARFVKGLSVGPQTDVGGGLHVVRESDAHAWIEAFVPGEGWVKEDPTPPGQFAGARSPAGTFDRLFQRARAALASAWNRLSVRGPLAFLAWLGRETVSLARRAAREPLAWLIVLLLAVGPRLVPISRASVPGIAPPSSSSAASNSRFKAYAPQLPLRLGRARQGRWNAQTLRRRKPWGTIRRQCTAPMPSAPW